jgi:hypothetical protein
MCSNGTCVDCHASWVTVPFIEPRKRLTMDGSWVPYIVDLEEAYITRLMGSLLSES